MEVIEKYPVLKTYIKSSTSAVVFGFILYWHLSHKAIRPFQCYVTQWNQST